MLSKEAHGAEVSLANHIEMDTDPNKILISASPNSESPQFAMCFGLLHL